MKALMKPESSQYFRRIEKKVEDPQVTMNNIEAKKLALEVGIDASEMKKYSWFFQLVIKLKLPQNYTRFLNSSKDQVIYLNLITHEQTLSHPSTNFLKIFFYQTLTNNKAIYTFQDKQGKLLPFVEQKMLRQSIGLNSKRRQGEKVNLQRDASGRMVMSKLQKLNPDFRGLMASRSYVLKMLIEKVFTRREIVGKGKRAGSYLSVINDYRQLLKQSNPDKQDEQQQRQEDLALYHSIFQGSAAYYQRQFGNLQNIPARLVNSREYIESTPENVLKNIFLLNIDKDNIELYWLARMMDCLPLPPNWSKKKGTSFDSYIYEPQQLLFDIHPSYIYVMVQLNKFKSIFKDLGTIQQNYYLSMRQLNFYDFFERKYTVDMYGYVQRQKRKEEVISKTKDKKTIRQNQNSDWMVLEGIKNTPIVQETYVLAEEIERFWDSLDFNQQPFRPSISPYGEVVWSSTVTFKSVDFNPYKGKLGTLVRNKLKNFPQITDDILKPQYKITEQKDEDQITLNIQKLTDERQQFLRYYLTHIDKAVPWPYEIKSQYPILDENNYYQQIFTCPFQLDKGIISEDEEEKPFWLQKVDAKKHTIHHANLLTFNKQDFSRIKSQIVGYILQMVGEHEPHLLQQTQKKLNRITNHEDLIKYLAYINDLDLRQQRKRIYLEQLKKLQEDSDIFGSEISQLQVDQRLEEDDSDDQQPQQLIKEEVKQPSIHKQKSVHQQSQESEDEIIQSLKEQESVIEYVQERKQYEFLVNFQRKKYRRREQISLKRQEQLQKMMKDIIKIKVKKSKYKTGIIKRKINRFIKLAENLIENKIIIQEKHSKQLRNQLQRNLISTRLRKLTVPYKLKIGIKLLWRQSTQSNISEFCCSQITDYDDFHSQISDYDNSQINTYIIEYLKNRRQKDKIRTPTERSSNQHEQTMDTIQLQPIHQIKPQIALDPVLRHVKKLSGELNQFRSTFNAKMIKNPVQIDMHRDNIRKVDSLKNLSSLRESNYASTPVPARNNSVKKLDLQSKLSFSRKQGFGSLPKFQTANKHFHRVCLQKTASHFLEKQAFLRKGDIITMEARKTLLSKGRGIQTYISKFY